MNIVQIKYVLEMVHVFVDLGTMVPAAIVLVDGILKTVKIGVQDIHAVADIQLVQVQTLRIATNTVAPNRDVHQDIPKKTVNVTR